MSNVNYTDISEKRIHELYESSINRLVYWMEHYDIATITAFRNELTNIKNPDKTLFAIGDTPIEPGHHFTVKENRERNKGLYALLHNKGYGVIKIVGSYVESGQEKESIEESFFVVNLRNDSHFKDNIILFGEYFNQDSILYKKAGEKDAYLIGTNDNEWIEYHTVQKAGSLRFLAGRLMSRIKNAAFAFATKDTDVLPDTQSLNDYPNNDGQVLIQNHDTSFNKRKRQRINEWYDLCNNNGIEFPKESHQVKWAIGQTAKRIMESLKH